MFLRFFGNSIMLFLGCLAAEVTVWAEDDPESFRSGAEAESANSSGVPTEKLAPEARSRFSVYGRLQVQGVNFASDAREASDHDEILFRRVRLGLRADLTKRWTADANFDFGDDYIDRLLIAYRDTLGGAAFSLTAGIRKVNFGLEENTSSGRLKAIERSGTTRYFVEPNNGRRLGAGKQRLGIFFDTHTAARSGQSEGFYFGAAVTNPAPRGEGWDGVSVGFAPDGKVALWADVGFGGRSGEAVYRVGAAIGVLPGQGGFQATPGRDLEVASIYGAWTRGRFSLATEVMAARVEAGGLGGGDATPRGGWLESSWSVNQHWEFTARASYTDSDGRGIRVSDGVRSAPASLVGDSLTETFFGFSYYFSGADLKLQTGYVRGRTERPGARETAEGFRSMLALNF
jgi:hypothetical protein